MTSLLIMPAALAWMFFAEITVYEVSSQARLEVMASPSSIATVVEGRVVQSNLQVGNQTVEGDVLVVLDGEAVVRAIEERRRHSTAVRAHRTALLAEIQAEEQAIAAEAKARVQAVEESRAKLAEAEVRARFAQQSLERALVLASTRAVAVEQVDEKRMEAKATQELVKAAQAKVKLVGEDRLSAESQLQAEVARLHSKAVELEGELSIDEATLKRLEHDLEDRTVRAPVSGRIEEKLPFRLGTVIRAGEKLGTIVPLDETRVVAFVPVAAVGRVRPQQAARLRLDGFPWTQYGTVAATVSAVGNEASDGLIRVELSVARDPTSRIPLQHGQTGSVEIAVERASPAVLVLRAAGQYLMSHRPSTRP